MIFRSHWVETHLASAIHRLLEKHGLLKKLDPESYTYQLHVHCFRKYFFTNLIQSGVERGVAEFLVGHKFGLDANYLRMMEEKLHTEYDKAIDHFTFLSEATAERLEDQLKKKDALLASTNERLARLEGRFGPFCKPESRKRLNPSVSVEPDLNILLDYKLV